MVQLMGVTVPLTAIRIGLIGAGILFIQQTSSSYELSTVQSVLYVTLAAAAAPIS